MARYLREPYRNSMKITVPETVKSKDYHYFLLEDSIVAPPVEGYYTGDKIFIDGEAAEYSVEGGHIQCKMAAVESGKEVELSIDRPHRLQGMQNNIARILFTCALESLLHTKILSGSTEESCYLVVDAADIGFVSLEKIENYVNHLIESNLPIQEEKDEVTIPSVDKVHSVGPLLKNTGEVALFAVQKIEKVEEGLKLTFVCGKEALDDYRNHRYLTKNLSMYLKENTTQGIWQAVKKLQGKIDEQKKKIDALEEAMGKEDVEEFLAKRRTLEGVGYIYTTLENINFKSFKRLSAAIQKKAKTVQIYGIPNGNEAQIHVIRSADVSVDLKDIMDRVAGEKEGTGNMYHVQVNVPRAQMGQIMEAFLIAIQKSLA